MPVDLRQLIRDESARQGVPAALALAVAQKESGTCHWRPIIGGACDPAGGVVRGAGGEVGIFQLMPATAADLGVDPFDVYQNIRGGVTYLRQQLQRYGQWDAAIIGYNCGPGCADDVLAGRREIPAGTLAYLAYVGAVTGYGASPIAQRMTSTTQVASGSTPGSTSAPASTARLPSSDTAAQPAAPLVQKNQVPLLVAAVSAAALGVLWWVSD